MQIRNGNTVSNFPVHMGKGRKEHANLRLLVLVMANHDLLVSLDAAILHDGAEQCLNSMNHPSSI